MSSFHLSLTMLDDVLAVGPGPGAADGQIRVPRVFTRPHKRPEPPEQLVQAVDDHVAGVDRGDLGIVGVLAEEARADDLVPELERARAVAEEEDHRLAQLLDADDLAAGGVKEHGVGPGKIGDSSRSPSDP